MYSASWNSVFTLPDERVRRPCPGKPGRASLLFVSGGAKRRAAARAALAVAVCILKLLSQTAGGQGVLPGIGGNEKTAVMAEAQGGKAGQPLQLGGAFSGPLQRKVTLVFTPARVPVPIGDSLPAVAAPL